MVKYSEYDWDELPENIQHAAIKLGYTQATWDNDEDTSISCKNWAELTTEQKAAAADIGYTADTWDE